jgi:hypothetical protein
VAVEDGLLAVLLGEEQATTIELRASPVKTQPINLAEKRFGGNGELIRIITLLKSGWNLFTQPFGFDCPWILY